MSEPVNLAHPRHWLSWFWMGVLRIIGSLPFPVIYGLSSILGEIFYRIVPSRAHITLLNIKLCFPQLDEKERKHMARRHFRLLVCSLLSIGTFWWSSRSRLQRIVKLKGIEHLEHALTQGHGVILLAPHFIALDAGGLRMSMDRKMSTMYQTNKNPVFDHIILQARRRFNGDLIDRKAPLTRLIRSIRSGTPFYYLPDQNAGPKHGLFVPFFGVQASTFPVLGKISQAGKAVVIPCSNQMIPWRGIETVLGPPLENFPTGDAYDDTLRMNQEIEKMVSKLGANYLWSHKRFKRRPEGEADLYAR
jgi:KDO2-lipid IV(A) lauroyltransferase